MFVWWLQGGGTAVCRAHGADGCWSKFFTTILLHPSSLQIVLSPSSEDGYCLLVLMAWQNRKVDGAIAQRMEKFHSYLCQSMLGLDPKSHSILGIRDLWDTDSWIILQLRGVYTLDRTNHQDGILEVVFLLFSKREDGGGCCLNGSMSLCVSFSICNMKNYQCWFYCCFTIINKEPGELNAPLLTAWFYELE